MSLKLKLKGSARHGTEANWSGGSREKIVGRNGDINAGSKRELMDRQLELARLIAAGDVFTDHSGVETQEGAAVNLEEAYADNDAWAELGTAMADELTERMQREGFMRSVFNRGEVAEGSTVRIRMRTPNVTAIMSRGVGNIYPQYVRDKFLTPDEFTIMSNPRVEELDIHQGSGNILEDKFYEAQEQIMVVEDRVMLNQLRMADGIYNSPIYFVGNFTPVIMRAMIQNISEWALPTQPMLISQDIMSDFLVGNEFSSWYDPISKYEIVTTGRLGTVLGQTLMTDGFREEGLRVIDRGEVFVMTTPQFLGTYTDRGPVQSEPQNGYADGVPAKGWFMKEHVSITLANAKGVVRAKRQ
jgi:hypothetical protein